ncbi:hypothetical protein AB205_0115030 [Aquarana catesbeiana]|uniref:C2H2-type domain-containing protein n=1 Tax=Aquarana catesbeiana TaxID=8400 RepID=A0A2G9SEJ5_AQUCT|nr:hypothetical protein AB205_0115030 [Aquarana catesbeiana]
MAGFGCPQHEGGARSTEEGPKMRRIQTALCKSSTQCRGHCDSQLGTVYSMAKVCPQQNNKLVDVLVTYILYMQQNSGPLIARGGKGLMVVLNWAKDFRINSMHREKQKTHGVRTAIRGGAFSCSECGECFLQRTKLLSHQRTHNSEKPYSCSECGKLGEKPFSCSECGRQFPHRPNLIAHQMTHAAEKPYSCLEFQMLLKKIKYVFFFFIGFECFLSNESPTLKKKLVAQKV